MMNPETEIYTPAQAIPLMGFLCSPKTASYYIQNMYIAGLLPKSYKVNNHWMIHKDDIRSVKEKIMAGEYRPSSRVAKKVA